MSSSGGGHIILAHDQIVWTSPDMSKTLTLINTTGSNITVSADDCATLAMEFCPDPYSTVQLSWNGSAWSVTGGPSE